MSIKILQDLAAKQCVLASLIDSARLDTILDNAVEADTAEEARRIVGLELVQCMYHLCNLATAQGIDLSSTLLEVQAAQARHHDVPIEHLLYRVVPLAATAKAEWLKSREEAAPAE